MVKAKKTIVKSIADYLEVLKANSKSPVWYRGHSNSQWELVPSLLRASINHTESYYLKKFKQNAYVHLSQKPSNEFEWLFFMQHFGIPTRLLDWSESPLVALYFAVSENESHDAVIWTLDPIGLNKYAGIDSKELGFIPSSEDSWLQNYSPANYAAESTSSMKPMAFIATRNNPRIQAQMGTFTISHRDNLSLEKIGTNIVGKIDIPKGAKMNIWKELRLLKVSHFQMFPELQRIRSEIED